MSVSNAAVAHAWAHGQAAKSGNMHTDGNKLYSYSTLVGFNTGRGLVFLSASSMTSSTGKQLSGARSAVRHLDVVYSPVFRYGQGGWGVFNEKQAFRMACETLNETLEGFSMGRLSKYLASSIDHAFEEAHALNRLATKYDFDATEWFDFPADKLKAARDYAAQFEVKQAEQREKARMEQHARMEQQRHLDAFRFNQWHNGITSVQCPASYRLDANGGYYLAVRGDKVVTSGGAECPIEHARVGAAFWASRKHTGIEPACIFEPWTKNGHQIRLGMFQLDRIDEKGNAFAGCHKFTAEELRRLAALLV